MRKISELNSLILRSKGYDVDRKLNSLNNMEKIFYRNFSELIAIHKYIENDPLIMSISRRTELDNFQLELARRLHNYLASVKSLIDQTRRLIEKFEFDENLREEYKRRVSDRLGKDEFHFVQETREYTQHHQLLPTGVQFRIVKVGGFDKEDILLTLDRNELLNYSKWSAASKTFLSACDGDIDLISLVNKYTAAVAKFYYWFYKTVEDKYKTELDELESIRKEYQKQAPHIK